MTDTTIQQNSYTVDKLYRPDGGTRYPDGGTRHPDEGTWHPDEGTRHPEAKKVCHLQKRAFQMMVLVFKEFEHH